MQARSTIFGSSVLCLGAATFGAACGKSDSEGGSASAAEPAGSQRANDAIPAELAGKLSFVEVAGEKDRFVAVAPANWVKSEFVTGSYEPPEGAALGFMTRYGVSSNCDGTCEPKDWAPVVDKVEFSQYQGAQFSVVKDEQLGWNGRLLVATSQDTTYVVAAWWKPGASRYFYCRATLAKEIAAAAPAFEQACRSLSITAW
jgi:hypothetical protein